MCSNSSEVIVKISSGGRFYYTRAPKKSDIRGIFSRRVFITESEWFPPCMGESLCVAACYKCWGDAAICDGGASREGISADGIGSSLGKDEASWLRVTSPWCAWHRNMLRLHVVTATCCHGYTAFACGSVCGVEIYLASNRGL